MSTEQSDPRPPRPGAGRFDAVVFDFGGVYTASPFTAMERAAAELGMPAEQVMGLIFGPYDADTDHPWHQAERGQIDLGACRDAIADAAAAEGVELDLFEMLGHLASSGGVREAVVAHTHQVRARGVRTALLTNNVAEFAEFWRPLLPLDELFDVVVDSSDVGMRKPDERIYRHTLELLGSIDPDRAIFLDDFPGNVAAAQALGMAAILVEDDPEPAFARLHELLAAG